MHRFFLTDRALECSATVDLNEIRHQLWRVLRMRAGDRILLLTGDGNEYLTQLQEIDENRAIGNILQKEAVAGEPTAQLTLYQCALKGDRLEWVLLKGTELGVSRFVPVISARTIVRPVSTLTRKTDRWRAIIREAAEQSGRGQLPVLDGPMTFDEAVVVADGIRVLPWEEASACPNLPQALDQSRVANLKPAKVSLLIGPEGGITEDEMQTAVDCGWQPVTLGPRILCAETAALSAISITMAALGDMG